MNLRKDHCRDLPSRTTRELVVNAGDAWALCLRALARVALGFRCACTPACACPFAPRGALTNPGANCAKDLLTRGLAPVAPGHGACVRDATPPFIIYNDSRQRISRLSHR